MLYLKHRLNVFLCVRVSVACVLTDVVRFLRVQNSQLLLPVFERLGYIHISIIS